MKSNSNHCVIESHLVSKQMFTEQLQCARHIFTAEYKTVNKSDKNIFSQKKLDMFFLDVTKKYLEGLN